MELFIFVDKDLRQDLQKSISSAIPDLNQKDKKRFTCSLDLSPTLNVDARFILIGGAGGTAL